MSSPLPEFTVPPSTDTVDVSIIDTTSRIRAVEAWKFLEPRIEGHDYLAIPCYSFLVHNLYLNRTVVFDLGIRKDWENVSPALLNRLKLLGDEPSVEKGVRDILDDHGVDTKSIEAVIWSHSHFDHVGDPSTFEPETALVVGPGFKEARLPGYPADPNSLILESDYTGRELREISSEAFNVKIGPFNAFDYFGDGSFYLIDAPGHEIGHICGFARVTSNPDSFILMGGDSCHHGGEIRPSPYMSLPESITPNPFKLLTSPASSTPCPGALFERLLPNGKTQPFYQPSHNPKYKTNYDPVEATRFCEKVQEADARDIVFVVPAHDEFVAEIVDFFPMKANGFAAKGWAQRARWRFLKDFATAVGEEEEVEEKAYWGPSSKEH